MNINESPITHDMQDLNDFSIHEPSIRPGESVSSESKLLPCPFCGGAEPFVFKPTCDKDSPYDPADRAYPSVRCRGCYAEVGGINWDDSCKSAIKNWNNRHPTNSGGKPMSNEDILRMAGETGFDAWRSINRVTVSRFNYEIDISERLRKFAALVQAATAEECAKVCDWQAMITDCGGKEHHLQYSGAAKCAKAIRTKFQDQGASSGDVNNGD